MNTSPSHDPKLLDLKRIAEAGSDEGPQFDKGMQFVIEEIVNDHHFVHNGFATSILTAAREHRTDPGSSIPDAIQGFLDENGWTLQEGAEYARGIEYAEHELGKYRVVKSNED